MNNNLSPIEGEINEESTSQGKMGRVTGVKMSVELSQDRIGIRGALWLGMWTMDFFNPF